MFLGKRTLNCMLTVWLYVTPRTLEAPLYSNASEAGLGIHSLHESRGDNPGIPAV
jgi:hypothetical protein